LGIDGILHAGVIDPERYRWLLGVVTGSCPFSLLLWRHGYFSIIAGKVVNDTYTIAKPLLPLRHVVQVVFYVGQVEGNGLYQEVIDRHPLILGYLLYTMLK
jgi:hypothetical protein